MRFFSKLGVAVKWIKAGAPGGFSGERALILKTWKDRNEAILKNADDYSLLRFAPTAILGRSRGAFV
jgi:hypothetical protein